MIKRLSGICFIVSGLLAAAAGIYIAAAPQTVHSITARNSVDGTLVEESSRRVSWFAVQGWWGILVLMLFAGLFIGTAWLVITKRYRPVAPAVFSAIILTYLSGFSIGGYYLPALIALLLGAALLLIERPWRRPG